MRFEDLSLEDQKLLNTDLGDFEKEAAAELALADEMYSVGFNKLAAETADYLDSLYAEKVAAEKEEEEERDEEEEKKASDLAAFIERGYFDGLRKLGSERHGDEMAYILPFVEEKVAEAGAMAALDKLAEEKRPLEKHEKHYMRRFFLGNPISSAIEAKEGKRLSSFGKALGNQLVNQAGGAVGGAGVGAGVGALAALASKGRLNPKDAAKSGAGIGAGLGNAAGAFRGAFGRRASEIHGEHSANK